MIVIRLQGSSIGRLAKAIIEGKNIHDIEEIKIHADWVDEWLDFYDITTENIESIIQKELRIVLCRFWNVQVYINAQRRGLLHLNAFCQYYKNWKSKKLMPD